jgi:aminopeptidase N
MSNFLGEDTFRRGVSLYLRKFQFRNANQDDLWSCLEEQAQIDKSLIRLGKHELKIELIID